jgi:hypothetical protein
MAGNGMWPERRPAMEAAAEVSSGSDMACLEFNAACSKYH